MSWPGKFDCARFFAQGFGVVCARNGGIWGVCLCRPGGGRILRKRLLPVELITVIVLGEEFASEIF